MLAVPKSLINAEVEKASASIEKDVLGHLFDDDVAYTELPAVGVKKDELVSMLDRYSEIDETHWNTGKVRGRAR